MLDLVERQLKTFKYHTYKASSVSEAIEVLKNFNIDLLISDLNMPNINSSCCTCRSSCTFKTV
ncbi:response regulator [Flavobacterium ustbae]|uniref:hypothetical protein n=1 Tax=Flavobacterium ustbae TaxID=2488790 RepID=UPI001F333FD2|nr:hypothetical protein [Flavobacterium ustbae]